MSKKQIKVSAEDVKGLIREALDMLGNQRYPEGVFSTDSEEGEALKDYARKYDDPKKGNSLRWDPIERKLKDAADSVSGEKWTDTIESSFDSGEKRDKVARDQFKDEKEESDRYEKPFGDMDDAENQWDNEPGYGEEDDDEDIAGINEGKVTLTEEGLRNFISYSVARILQERMGEENRGIMTHFDGSSSFQPKNPYEGMTWDEYCAAKAEERAKDKEREMKDAEVKDEKPNRGIMTHFNGEKHERTPEDIERDEHMFDDQYWVDKMNLSKDDLMEIVTKCVRRLTEGLEPAPGMEPENDEEKVVEQYPTKASGTFTMNTRSGKTDKYKVFVEKTPEEELLTDIFIYDPMDKEWYPQAEYVVGIEEYKDGSWLPYWETFNGDVSIRALANCFGKVVKLWQKVGYLYDEDDEIPFRYAGDIKGLNGKRY